MGKLNKESSVPLYQQLMEVIQNQILNGELKENDRIPTEIELSREYDVKPLLYVKDVSYDREGNPVHNCKSVINPDRYKMTVMVNA